MTNEEFSKVLHEYYCKYNSLRKYLEENNIYINEGDLEKVEDEMRKDLEDEWDELLKGN